MQKQEKKSKFEFDIETADNHVRTVSFSPDGRYLATGGSNIVRGVLLVLVLVLWYLVVNVCNNIAV